MKQTITLGGSEPYIKIMNLFLNNPEYNNRVEYVLGINSYEIYFAYQTVGIYNNHKLPIILVIKLIYNS